MKKKVSIILNGLLMLWFLLDITGLTLGGKTLVTQAYKEDGIFFLIFLGAFVWYLIKDKVGKYVLSSWLFIWFVGQFASHWYFTIFGPWEGKKRFFADTIPFIVTEVVYIPDLYHVILHILILAAFISTVIYDIACIQKEKVKQIKQ